MVQAWCMKEKKKVTIKDPKFELNGIGSPVARGTCASCGGKVYAILGAKDVPADLKAKSEKFKAAKKKGGAQRKSRKSAKSTKSRKSRKSTGSRKSRKSRK